MGDQVLLRRILHALGIGVLSAGQGACDSLSERGEPDSPPPSLPGTPSLSGTPATSTSGEGVPARAGAGGSFDNGVPVAGSSIDPASMTQPMNLCPAEVVVAGIRDALAAMAQCQVAMSSFTQAVCVTAADPDNDAGSSDCEAARPDDECLLRLFSCGLASNGDRVACGPFTVEPGACCYLVQGGCPVGRPFVVGGVARLAPLGPGAQWCEPLSPLVDGLSPALRAALAEAWRQDGAFEHASVASFSRFALQLLAQGAPAALVDGALRAARDEVEHARLCLGLAAAYGGAPRSPGSLRTDDALRDGTDALTVAVSLAAEGCVAETVSAQLIAAARERATEPVVRAALATMARDEAEHVELAWRALAWLLRRGDKELHDAVAQVFAQAHTHVGFGARVEHDVPDATMADHGYLSIPARRQLAEHTLQRVVLPAARLLLSEAGPRSTPVRAGARTT